jgi:hypothetical protein
MLLKYAASLRLLSVQSNLHRLTSNFRKPLAPALGSDYTAAVRGAATFCEATKLKQFPYMELLDSNRARKDY